MLKRYKQPHINLLLLIVFFSLIWQLGVWGLTESSEARYAEIPREMMLSGNFLLPKYLGILHFDKPLMTYWITALGYKIWGINAFGARFFLQVAFIVQLILVYRMAKILFYSRKVALYALICYAAIPLTLISIRNLTTDAYLNTFALLAVYLYCLFRKNSNLLALYGFFFVLGVAIFTKGPFALILPLLALYPINQHIKSQKSTKWIPIHLVIGTVIMLCLGGWWFFYLMYSSKQFYQFFIGDQIVNRVAHADKLNRSNPFWYYFALLPLFIIPVLGVIINWLKNVKKVAKGINLFALFTILIPLFIFSCSSSKLILYILPIAPYIALCCGYRLNAINTETLKQIFNMNTIFYALLIVAFIMVSTGIIKQIPIKPNVQIIIFLLFLAGYFVYTLRVKIAIRKKILLQLLIIPLIVLPLSTNILRQIEVEINSTTPLSTYIKAHYPNSKVLVWNRVLNSLEFNLKSPIYSIKYNHYSLDRKTQFQPDSSWKQHLIDVNHPDEQSYLKQLLANQSVLIRLKKDEIPADLSWITQTFVTQKDFGKYIIYGR